MAYTIHLDNFEGPLDLLLYFIQRDKIDIYDIPIARITAEYLEYLDIIKALNLAVAGEFVLLAATLMRIKARMLLPRREVEGEELIEDPRQELVQQLIAYQQFKQAAEELGSLKELRSAYYPVAEATATADDGSLAAEYLQEVSLFDLMAVFQQVLRRMPTSEPLRLTVEPIKLDDQMRHLRQVLASRGQVALRELLLEAENIHAVVVMFLALLELMRRQAVVVVQKEPFDEVTVRPAGAEA